MMGFILLLVMFEGDMHAYIGLYISNLGCGGKKKLARRAKMLINILGGMITYLRVCDVHVPFWGVPNIRTGRKSL